MATYPQTSFSAPAGATRITLVRHGQSEAAELAKPFALKHGHGDPNLTDLGRQQAIKVADRLVNKLITRHPHVFAADDAGNSSDSSDAFDADSNDGGEAAQPESPEAVLALWEKMKQQEKHRKSVLEGISRVQGALPRAAKVVSRISKSPNADRLFAAFDEPAAADAQRDDVHPQAANQSESSGDNSAEREKADAYADEILAVVRKARVDGIDIESALRNRLRDVEEKVALIESEINND